MSPDLNRPRALAVLGKIDEILSWECKVEQEKDSRFVELGRYLCEVRAGQYWKIENLGSFDAFLTKRFPESRRKAYYLRPFTNSFLAKSTGSCGKWVGRKQLKW